MSRHPYEILVKPHLTERAAGGAELDSKKYTFRVALNSNKVQIRRAVEAAFGVRVAKVNTVRIEGKRKRLKTKQAGKRPDWKKAIVTLVEGDEINLI